MAVRTLIAVAVRSARSLGLHQDPLDESFFDQQARSRLWLTICLLDIQSSVAQLSEPLISYREAASALARVQHINDSDFDPTTATPVTDREGLTDTTFTLINYQVELAGNRLRLPPSDLADDRKTSTGSGVAAYSNRLHGQQMQESQIRLFEQASLCLLRFCDPDSSAYAWFTCHSIQCLVAAVRLAALSTYSQHTKDVQGHQSMMAQQANRAEGSRNSELLRQALGYLKKMQTVQTDSRSEGFRWYLKMPWSALAIAIGECNVCADITLVQRAWPLLQGWYQLYERSGDKVISAEIVALMQQMQATASHHSGQQPSGGQSGRILSGYSVPGSASTVLLTTGSGSGEVPSALGEADIPLVDFENVFEADRNPSTHLLSPLVWDENILYYKSVRGD
ncbi:fungal specific transcription factor domain-containing protein [Aspergillus foveolatus]|uniref:fungal specific transcription factor domain-containing protein n=1 Tax=Aspergillus foveolatus TaxID=210207 RepID=UPI003CCCF18F